MNSVVKTYEELSMNAHPSLCTTYYDGWVLRFASGYTNRANSVNMLHSGALPVDEKIDYCESAYSGQKLPTVFKITPITVHMDANLDKKQYKIVTPTTLMTMAIPNFDMFSSKSLIEDEITGQWQSNYFRLNQTADSIIPIAKQIQGNITNKILCATVYENDVAVACGLCVVEREYAGLYDIIVDSRYRRKGYGYDICASLIRHSVEYGAKTAYLQVVSDNANAFQLYKKMGFAECYQYWYRVKPL